MAIDEFGYEDVEIKTESDMEEFLLSFFYDISGDPNYPPFENCDTRTFYESGLLTSDKGIVLKLANGSEFQLTIVRSK